MSENDEQSAASDQQSEIEWLCKEVDIVPKEMKNARQEKTPTKRAIKMLDAYGEHLDRISERLLFLDDSNNQ